MSWLGFIVNALSLLSRLTAYLNSKQLLDAGAQRAIADGFRAASAEVDKALAIRREAEAMHRADATDGAFDKDFMRKD